MANQKDHLFTCKNCGSHDLRIEWEYAVIHHCKQTLPCDCGKTIDGIAAQYDYDIVRSYRYMGFLDETHHWEKEESEMLDEEKGEDNLEVFCNECYETAEDDWQDEDGESEKDPDSTEFYVYCDGCDREIEFGWSHPDRGGRIWPAECTDFNPWKSWPEPRYRESWAKKNWLRPD